nr:GDSL-type esterase/lipase family protein [Sinorhizobium mexicanum]
MLKALRSRADCRNADVLIHIGLNDCVVRMFMEEQRLALSTLTVEIRQKIVQFAQVYRTPLVESDFDHTYTPLTVYEKRLEEAAKLARSNGARSVTFVTIIQPPTKFAAKTPHMSWSFNRFNMAVYDVAKRERCNLIDMDRICWEQGTQKTLSPDGMHLSAAGHALMAENFMALLKI